MKTSILSAIALVATFALSAGAAETPAASSAKQPAPASAPDQALKIVDLKVGDGVEAKTGRPVWVWYTGWLYDPKAPDQKGEIFDSTDGKKMPFGVFLGVGKVIKGWDQGVPGMKVGGKRRLVIPPELAYGEKGAGKGKIPPNATLIFEIELADAK